MLHAKIGILIICRLNSKRLDKKIFKKVNGKSLLEILIIRLSKKFDKKQIVICSSTLNKNIKFLSIAKKYGVRLYYGDDKDIFFRMINAAKRFHFDNIVRITGDNPLTDIEAIIKMSKSHLRKKSDFTYTTNLMIGTRPEIIRIAALKKCRNLSCDKLSSEYMTYYFLQKGQFKINRVKFKEILKNQNKFSVTIDLKKDYLLLKKILKSKNYFLSHNDILRFLKKNKLIQILPFKRFIPTVTKKYDVRLKNNKDLKLIDLKKLGYN